MTFRVDIALLLVCIAVSVAAQSCTSPDGGTGSCQSTSSPCSGLFYPHLCPGPADVQCCATNWGSCTASGVSGTCQTASSCSGTSTPHLCPGPSDVECCTQGSPSPGTSCSTNDGGSGQCQSTSSSCSGIFYQGFCAGPADIECCATSWGSCDINGMVGTCQTTGSCSGVSTAGVCPGPGNVECCTPSTPPGPSGQLNGIDVSSYQGGVDFQSVKNSGISFAFAKATEGTSYVDPTFANNWQNMLAAGLVRGAYHFGHANEDANTQAQLFVNTVINAGGFKMSNTLPLVLDIEVTDNVSSDTLWAWTQTFCATVHSMTGRAPIIYTGYYFWTGAMGNPGVNLGAPLWIAAYTDAPRIPPAWTGYTFWQHSDKGSVPGVSGNVDISYFAGSAADLQALCYP